MNELLTGATLALILALGPNGAAYQPSLTPPAVHPGLPLEPVAALLPELWLVLHERDEWTMAFSLPADAPVLDLAFMLGDEKSRDARLLPGLEVPRLMLYAPFYRPEGRWLDGGEMAVDVAENLYHALLEARITWLAGRDPAFARELDARAGATMVSVPETLRGDAFRTAAADFAANVLSVASELARSERRRREGGRRSLCRLIDHPATLFTTWRRQIVDGAFPGRYTPPAKTLGRRSPAVTTREVLSGDDKRWILDRLLEVDWIGDPRRDFLWLCPPG